MLRIMFSFALLLLFCTPSYAVHKVDLINTIQAGKPRSVTVDEEGTIYSSQKDGTVLVLSPEGRTLMTLGGKTSDGKAALKEPRNVWVYGDQIYIADRDQDKIVIYKIDGAYAGAIGKGGSKHKEFNSPRGIYVFGGVIYVADTGNKRIQILGPNGVFMDSFPPAGGDELLKEPEDIAVDPIGRIFVLDKKAKSLRMFDPSGKLKKSIESFKEPVSFALDVDGLYVADASNYKISKFDFEGKELYSFGSKGKEKAQFLEITGIAVSPEGKLYISDIDKGTISVFLPEGRRKAKAPRPVFPDSVKWLSEIKDVELSKIILGKDGKIYGIGSKDKSIYVIKGNSVEKTIKIPKCEPVSLAQDSKGALWVLDEDKERVLQIDDGGNIIKQFSSGGGKEGYLSDPSDIAVSDKGIIFVADTGNRRVQAFSKEGVFLQAIGSGKDVLKRPVVLSVDYSGVLYVIDKSDKTITVFNPDGSKQRQFGGENVFKEPSAVSTSRNEVFVLDSGANEILVFGKEGNLIRRFSSEGEEPGDLKKPASFFLNDATELYIADTGNKRIESFYLIYTPDKPQNLQAKPGMRSARLTWGGSTEEYIEGYRIYREESGEFNEIASVRLYSYEDIDLSPDVNYSYKISAVARGGNESPLSEKATVKPTKLIPSPPSGLAAKADEWSVELSWNPNAEPFVKEYAVYREIDAAPVKIGVTNGTLYTESALEQETAYVFYVAAVSTDDVESEKTVLKTSTKVATKPPVEVEVVELNNVFSNSYKIYENEGIGRVKVVNNTREEISSLRVSFTMQNFMDFPSEVAIENLPPGKSKEAVLKAVFNNNILQVTEDTPVQTEIKATYYRNQKPVSVSKSHTINVYDKHRMMWDTRERFAAFVTPKDPAILEYVRSIITQFPEADNPIVTAAAVFDALSAAGMTYIADPSNPYQITSEKTDIVDYIQYPQETLKRNSGDCDDLVGLYSSALEGLGIRTKVLEVPGHMFIMFSSSIPDKPGIDLMDGMFVRHQGFLWIPVEVTMVGGSFLKAWERGSGVYHEWEGKGLDHMDIRKSWERFKPATLPPSDLKLQAARRADIEEKFPTETKTLRKIWIKYQGSEYVEALRKNPKNVKALNQLGILYAKSGEVEEAIKLFKSAIELDPEGASAWNNYGNANFLNGAFEESASAYEKASKADPSDPYILVNLARAYMKGGKREKAVEAFNKAAGLDPSVKQTHRSMAIELSGAF